MRGSSTPKRGKSASDNRKPIRSPVRPDELAATEKGGVGKTLGQVAITDYLHSKNYTVIPVDCDTGNASQTTCFNHWLGGKAVTLNLRHPKDRARLLSDSARSGAQFCIADLPGNSSGDLSLWIQDVATLDLIEELRLGMIAVGVVTPEAGSAGSVVKWISALGDRGQLPRDLESQGIRGRAVAGSRNVCRVVRRCDPVACSERHPKGEADHDRDAEHGASRDGGIEKARKIAREGA